MHLVVRIVMKSFCNIFQITLRSMHYPIYLEYYGIMHIA